MNDICSREGDMIIYFTYLISCPVKEGIDLFYIAKCKKQDQWYKEAFSSI